MKCRSLCCKLVARWEAPHKQPPPRIVGLIHLSEIKIKPDLSATFKPICIMHFATRFNYKKRKKEKFCKAKLNCVNSIAVIL